MEIISISNAIAVLCEKHGLNEQEFANMVEALNYAEENNKEISTVCAMFADKGMANNQTVQKET
ncbi:MAG: hypothetical protein K2J88_06585 [Oscillospiraceae bacterium]|nr:hypothetical protein [Oscillospiraceae bacterium]